MKTGTPKTNCERSTQEPHQRSPSVTKNKLPQLLSYRSPWCQSPVLYPGVLLPKVSGWSRSIAHTRCRDGRSDFGSVPIWCASLHKFNLLTKERVSRVAQRVKSRAPAVGDLEDTLKGVQGRSRNEAIYALGKLAERDSSQDTFRRKFYEPNFSHLFILRKALKSLRDHLFLMTSSNLLPRCGLNCMYPLHQVMYMLIPQPPPPLRSSSSELSEMLSSVL